MIASEKSHQIQSEYIQFIIKKIEFKKKKKIISNEKKIYKLYIQE